tara:strand:+ start:1709 stop:4624 length:2916 start_codon:yes stop_codon:yes gene_type:complete
LKRGKIIVKQSLSDAYRQYLEDVTIPMNTYFEAPEEFVTTKPSIYHSLRLQPATDARTGRIRNSPAIARALASIDNLQFQDDIKNFSLPLNTNQGQPLYGRHVYPGELHSLSPNLTSHTSVPDLPRTYIKRWGGGEKYRPLNLYGFTGDAATPQRFTNQTLQPEGIIYGNLDTNDVVQLNTRPASAIRLSQVARALSPFHPERDVKDLTERSEDLARDIMDAGIPPILAESNVDTKGVTQHLPFRLDNKIDVKEAHDPFVQYDMGNLNRPTPEGLEQFTLDSIRAGEPMDIAMQLLKEEIPYSSRDYPPQEISISTGNPLVTPKVAGETPEVCNMPGCDSGLPPVMYRRMANPIRSIDNHEFMCEQCAYKHDLQSLLFDKMIKGEITLMEYAIRKATLPTLREAGLSFEDLDALRFIPNYRKTSFYQPQLLNKPANIDYEIRTASKKPEYKRIPGLQTELGPPQNNIHSYFVNPATRLGALGGDVTFMARPTLLGIRNNNNNYGVDFWRTKRQGAGSEGGEGLIYGELPKQNFVEIPINYTAADAMRAKLNLDHFMNTFHIPEEEAFEMLATRFPEVHNIASQLPNVNTQDTSWQQPAQYRGTNPLLLDEIDTKVASEPMDIAMQLLKQEPLQLRNSAELAELARQGDTEAYNEMMERTGDYYLANEITGEPDMEANLEAYGAETGKNPFKTPPIGRTNQIQIHQPPVTPIHADKKLHNWQYKNASEPMEIAMQLLKRELHPGRDIEGYLKDDGHYAGEEELYNLNDPEVQNFVNRLHLDKQPPVHLIPETLGMDLEYVEPELRVENRDTKLYHPIMMDEHENLDKFPDRKIVEREDGTKEELVSTSDPTSDVVGVGRTGRTLVSSKPTFEGIPFSEETGFTRSEPMEIAMQLLKERVSPEAKRHKLEYDKKYESSPERVKYREELNRERRRRHIMGRGGPDMSHTKDHTIVPESPHTNRARHFKDKGTLL